MIDLHKSSGSTFRAHESSYQRPIFKTKATSLSEPPEVPRLSHLRGRLPEIPQTVPRQAAKVSSPGLAHSRPIHVVKTSSLLSRIRKRTTSFKCDCGRDVGNAAALKFEGFKHLMMITLSLGSLRLLWIDSHIKGIRYALEMAGFQFKDLKYSLYLLAMNAIYLPMALIIESAAASCYKSGTPPPKSNQAVFKWKFVGLLHIINATTCLVLSSIFCYQYIWNPLIGTICEANTIITFLKLTSFCLTVRDLRSEYLGGTRVYEYYGELSYPNNLTAKNVVYFWFAPTLVYQPVYPRTEKIRWHLVASLVGETVTGLFFIWMLGLKLAAPILRDYMEHYQARNLQLVDDFIKLCAVNITIWLLGFFVIFQSMLNLVAEVTRFADRDFYQDWWNAGCIGTYWRDWNKPVSNYLRRHIYSPLRKQGLNTTISAILVFFISAVLHELMVGVATKNFNGVAFFCMMGQVPMITITAPLEKIRGRGTTIGNCIFWLSILLGQPTGVIIYYVSWSLRYKQNVA